MEFRQLKYFLAVAEEGLIVRAAEKLNITQPPLSQQIKLLEEEIGSPLFIRDRKRIRLTATGEILKRRAQQLMDMMRITQEDLKDSADGVSGTLAIGMVASYGGALLPGLIADFNSQYPKVTFQLRQDSTREIMELAKAGLIELGFVHTPIDREVFDSFPLPKEDLMLADNGKFLPANHTDVSMSSLFDKPLLIHERYENAIISLCKEYGFAPHIFCKSDDIFPLPYWAAEGLGIAILPRSSIHLASGEKLYFHHIENLPLTTTGVIIHAKRYALSRIAQNFIQFWETRQEGHGHST